MFTLLPLCLALASGQLSAQQSAAISNELDKANADVEKKYDNRKPHELSSEERRERAQALSAAEKQVLDKAGVSMSAWSKDQQNGGREHRAERAQAKQALVEKERAAAEAAAQKPEEKPIVIQQGISDSSPVTLEDKPNESGEVVVEEGLPGDAVRDQAEASAVDGPGQSSPAPARKGGGKKR